VGSCALPKPAGARAPATPVPAAPRLRRNTAARPEPPPPGTELPIVGGDAKITFRLLDKAGEPVKDAAGKAYGKQVPVSIVDPRDYVETPVTKVTPGKAALA